MEARADAFLSAGTVRLDDRGTSQSCLVAIIRARPHSGAALARGTRRNRRMATVSWDDVCEKRRSWREAWRGGGILGWSVGGPGRFPSVAGALGAKVGSE
jgi:hypothetical protein